MRPGQLCRRTVRDGLLDSFDDRLALHIAKRDQQPPVEVRFRR
jgi:hypothetical protein